MKSSSLSPLKNRAGHKQNSPSVLPLINNSQTLKYHNDYQSYEDDLNQFQNKQREVVMLQESDGSIFSSSLSGSGGSNRGNNGKQQPKLSSLVNKQSQAAKKLSQKKIVPYKQSINFWNSSTAQKPYIQYSQKDYYKERSSLQIQRQVRLMRKQLQQMNSRLSQQLNEYNMAKSQYTSKQLMLPSKSKIYQAQIQTNNKVQLSQISQIKKLNQTQLLVSNKDVFIDLQNILIEMIEQLHHGRKQEHDSRLKNHKLDIVLDEIIKTNSDNKDNNQVKLLKLQIIYYMKRQNSLKTYEQQLDHQLKLIQQNDRNLDLKVEEIKANNKLYYLCEDKYARMKERYGELLERKKVMQKNVQTVRRANDIAEEKVTREIIQIDTQSNKIVQNKILQHKNVNEQLQHKINTLINAYHLNEHNLKHIKYKFLEDSTYPPIDRIQAKQAKPFLKNILKPTLRPNSKIQQSQFITQHKYSNTKSNQKLTSNHRYNVPNHRQNDKNISMTIDVNLQNDSRARSISDGMNNLKPKNFRILSKRQQQNSSQLDKQTSFSTIDCGSSSTKSVDKSIQLKTARLLKPNLLLSKASNTKI